MNRLGNWLLALGGCVLAGLMLYTLVWGGGRPGSWSLWGAPSEAAEVAVFFPDHATWSDFRQGINACAARKLARIVADDDAVLVETPAHARRVWFAWHDVRGLRETKDEVRRLIGQKRPPVAVVGSNNTVLTVALAEALRDSARVGGDLGPVLLVPWATTVLAERPEPASGPAAFLDLYPGRTFRFCPNNQSQADLVTRCLVDHDPGVTLERAEIVVDRHDPYSVDLADSFHRVLERRFKNAELIEHADRLAIPVLWNLPGIPSPSEDALAAAICREAERVGPGRVIWVVLPLQEEPARRMLVALQRHAQLEKRGGGSPLRVVCGDGIGSATLFRLANKYPFPVWCFSPASPPAADRAPDSVLATDAQVLAEIVSAVVRCLDVPRNQAPRADALRSALAALSLSSNDPAAFGRSLAFTPVGERHGHDLGHVLMIGPDSDAVTALARKPSGQWSATVLDPPVAVATWP